MRIGSLVRHLEGRLAGLVDVVYKIDNVAVVRTLIATRLYGYTAISTRGLFEFEDQTLYRGDVVFLMRPPANTNPWTSAMDKYNRSLAIVDESSMIDSGYSLRLAGQPGICNFGFGWNSVVPITKVKGALDNRLRNRCFVCNSLLPINSSRRCLQCNVSFI